VRFEIDLKLPEHHGIMMKFRTLQKYLTQFPDLLEKIQNVLLADMRERFAKKKDPLGHAWKPTNWFSALMREKMRGAGVRRFSELGEIISWAARTTLVDSGWLRDSLTKKKHPAGIRLDPRAKVDLHFGTRVPYAFKLDRGGTAPTFSPREAARKASKKLKKVPSIIFCRWLMKQDWKGGQKIPPRKFLDISPRAWMKIKRLFAGHVKMISRIVY